MTCAHCGTDPAERTWDMRPCAIGEQITFALCDACDLLLNRYVLRFFRVPQQEEMLASYASCDTRPEGGDSTKIEAPFTGGAVPEGQTPNPSHTPSPEPPVE